MSDLVAIGLSILGVIVALGWDAIVGAVKASLTAMRKPPEPQATAPVAGPAAVSSKITFPTAIDALAVVRNRLVETGCMDDAAKAAIEAVTHALVAGTDK